MKKQSGTSMVSLLLALAIASAMLAVTAYLGSYYVHRESARADFKVVMSDVFRSVEAAISDEWQETGCRTVTEPPSLSTLVSVYNAPSRILTTPYVINVEYRNQVDINPSSIGVKITVTMPVDSTISSYQLVNAAKSVADDVYVSDHQLKLYKSIATISSQLQSQYFDGTTGCMQEDLTSESE